jgi:type VI secretion system secreted protein Hcp
MALNAYLTIPGIQGPVTLKNRVGSILVYEVSHSIATPFDINGVLSGVYASRPFVITKELDITSPLLYTALTTHTMPPSNPPGPVVINFWMPVLNPAPGNDGEAPFFTITLNNPMITAINFNMANNLLPANLTIPPLETVTFTYSSIQWAIANGGAIANANYPGS